MNLSIKLKRLAHKLKVWLPVVYFALRSVNEAIELMSKVVNYRIQRCKYCL